MKCARLWWDLPSSNFGMGWAASPRLASSSVFHFCCSCCCCGCCWWCRLSHCCRCRCRRVLDKVCFKVAWSQDNPPHDTSKVKGFPGPSGRCWDDSHTMQRCAAVCRACCVTRTSTPTSRLGVCWCFICSLAFVCVRILSRLEQETSFRFQSSLTPQRLVCVSNCGFR